MKSLLIHPEELSKKWIDRMVSGGMDCLGIHPVGGREAHLRLAALLAEMQTDAFRAKLDDAAEKGLEIEYEMHCGSYLVPRELFAEHPEYFRVDKNGVRTNDRNFCPSNEAALELAADRAGKLAKSLYRSAHRFYFWLDDARDSRCHCKACARYTASDQQLLILNRLLREIKKDFPDARMAYLAYFETAAPPVKLRPDEGIFLEYAPFDRDMTKSSACVPDTEKENQKKLLQFFGTKDAKVLEYWYDNSLFSGWKKPPKKLAVDRGLVSESVDYYKGLGFENISSFACYLGEDYEQLHGDFESPVL